MCHTAHLLRISEWIFVAYFIYVAGIAAAIRPELTVQAAVLGAVVACMIAALARIPGTGMARDWLPVIYVLIAYREMNWFTPATRDFHLEHSWIIWDRMLLRDWGLRPAIESLGYGIPAYLELCYALVYAIGPFSIAALYAANRRARADRFLTVYTTGTLLSYALFPFFPSDPPRVVFAGADMPAIGNVFRDFNLFIVGSYGIHSSVFPSAHVSSAFAAAWGLMRFLPERPWVGRGMLIYAFSVTVATVYGRYHYAADALAGVAIGLAALAVAMLLPRVKTSAAGVQVRQSP
jgi:membrane-associated phospholipid phosphatase